MPTDYLGGLKKKAQKEADKGNMILRSQAAKL